MSKKKLKLPSSTTEKEEKEFFENLDLSEHFDKNEFKPISFPNLRMSPNSLAKITKIHSTVFLALFVVIATVVAFVVGGFVLSENDITKTENPSIPENVTQGPLPWPEYRSETLGFSIQHPVDVEVTEREDGISFFKKGPTQAEATEFYDGISIIFSEGSLVDTSLEEIARIKVDEMKLHATVTRDITQTTLNGINGYTFSVSGLGDFTAFILPKGNTEYLYITNGTADPTNQGFTETAKKMLSTLTINK